MTTELYTERVYDLVGDDYTVLSEFVDQRTKILGKKGMPYSVNTKRNVALPIYQSVITIKVSF